jgi:ATP-binding cassette subfamily F protein uup
MPPLLFLQDIHLTFGGTPLLTGADLTVGPRERLAVVGRNGSGKSTLLKIAAGLVMPDSGTRFLQPGTTLRYLPQEPEAGGFATTLAYVAAGLTEGDDPHAAQRALETFGLTGAEDTATLSGGELRRAALARVLAPEPDILILDEPTNHLDLPAIQLLEETLQASRSAIVLVSHDRRFLETLSETTLWVDRGQTRRLDRGFAAFEAWRDAILEEEEVAAHKLDRKIEREGDWLRYGVTARRKRNVRRLRDLQGLRAQRREMIARRAPGDVVMQADTSRVSGRLVIEAKGVSKSFGDRVIVQDFSTRIERGDKVGIIGANGAGKTTLLSLLTGVLAPDSGSVRLGANLNIVTLDQRRDSLAPETTLTEALTEGRGDSVTVAGRQVHVVTYLRDFLFRPEQARTPLKALSGGERGRLMLARALAQPSNLLVLDEPTNDLDLETLDLLQEMLADYPGTLLLVSHDRDFLDRVVGSVIVADGGGRWVEYAGGYSDMLAQKGSAPAARAAARPAAGAARPAAAAPREAPARRKLSFKDQHRLETLPQRIAALEAEIAGLEKELADPGLYARDPAGFERRSTAMAIALAEKSAAEEEWLRLEMLREELERG